MTQEDYKDSAPLSPAAQAVLDAYGNSLTTEQYATSGRIEIAIAAALRAAADLLRPDPGQSYQVGGIRACQSQLRAIATELENV